MKKNTFYSTLFLIIPLMLASCNKRSEWLDIKPVKNVVVPETLADFQAMLDHTSSFNRFYSNAGLLGADNFYLKDAGILSVKEDVRNLYTWQKNIWIVSGHGAWSGPYKSIEYANIVLEGLSKVGDSKELNNVKGQALFFRALSHYNLAQLFCKPYSTTASTDPGIPVRTSSDVNVIQQRSSVQETYTQITKDALDASTLLSISQPYVQRPVSAAAFALLAKIYLNKGEYDKATMYASKCIDLRPALLDFNNSSVVNPSTQYRFLPYARNNPEVLFYAEGGSYGEVSAISNSTGFVSADLYKSYEIIDLRKTAFFAVSGVDAKFAGAYTGSAVNFCGLAINEVYLVRAECYARNGEISLALKDLNSLLINRYKTGSFTPFESLDADEVLSKILTERRKELPYTGDLRWEDLRRLNKESRFQKTIFRVFNGAEYKLEPNDKRYVLPIPNEETQLSHIQQNDR